MEHLSNDQEDRPHQQKNSHNQREFVWKSMETETATWSEFPNGWKAIKEQILASKEKKSKQAGLLEWQSGIRVGKLRSFAIIKGHLWL